MIASGIFERLCDGRESWTIVNLDRQIVAYHIGSLDDARAAAADHIDRRAWP